MRGKKAMSIFASILRAVYRLSGVKKSFTLPENELRKEIEKQNRHRGVFTPTDHKAYYETITVNGRRQNAENVRRQCNEIHGYANGNVGVVCRLIPKAVDGGVRL
jgi:ribosomal protein S21